MATMLSGTRAMMAARVLSKHSEGCRQSAELLREDHPQAAENLASLADWYEEVARALYDLDTYRRPILHVLDSTTGESE